MKGQRKLWMEMDGSKDGQMENRMPILHLAKAGATKSEYPEVMSHPIRICILGRNLSINSVFGLKG